ELIHILQNHKKDNKISLENTNYKTLFKLFDKIENFKNYINKNPNSISQEKLQNIANNFIKNLNKNLALINKELAKPENIKIQNTHILKELSQNIKDLITLLKDIKNHKNKTEITQENLNKTPHTKDIKEELKEEIKTPQKNTEDKKETQQKQESMTKDKEIQNTKEEKTPQSKDIKENPKEEPKTPQKNTEEPSKNDSKSQNLQANNTKLEDIFKSTSGKILLEDIFKQNVSKNLNFSQNLQEELLNNLNKELGLIGRKLNEVLKALDPKNYEAKNSLDDIKNIEKKLELSIKDLGKITPKDTAEISSELQKDIKSTLLQISNLAKNLDNESILNQANRLIAQLEFNQLLSLANNSIHTFLPFFWDDLEKSNVVFKRGKKDKFYAQINLEFEKLGKINVFLSLSNDKYIDINMMIENANFRKKLYERAHELKKALVKVGLLSSNFFISDIVKSKFHNQEEYNDFNMGFDTRA
ncbi:flagellar hook-length control protein FliK, partial [Campylobacter lari]|nr:flagellar hook-length control protein FliK [Campylobacter lari]